MQIQVQPLLPMLEHSLDMNRSYGLRFDVSLRLLCDDREPLMVRADEMRLLQVIANLLSSAIKHSPPHSEVLVEVVQLARRVRITVHDAGPGLSEELRSRVFQRFAQADGSDAKAVSGTGLGLAIAKQMVELQGGVIGFDSGQSKVGSGNGASFRIELPIISNVELTMESCEPLNMNVLLCEDDPDVAEILIEMMHQEGCRVAHADQAAKMLEMLVSSYAVLMMDIDLPDRNGLRLVAELRDTKQWCGLPVVVVSASHFSDSQRALQQGLHILAWLDKPVDRTALRSALLKAKS
jgi:CheY-like chemotaxis protein